jgi:methionyl-tRNA formyltransferase
VRAFDPAPGMFTQWNGQTLKIWQAQALPGADTALPGTVLAQDAQGLTVQCAGSALRITMLQRAGAKRQVWREAAATLSAQGLHPGARFE